jgi:hypothetical protein
MTNFDTDSSSEADLEAEFDRLFPQGFAGPDVLQELAPAGWENSPLVAVFHPSLARSYEATLRLHRNVCALRRPNDQRPLPPEPTFDEVARDFRERPVKTVREVRELVGQCLWDVFSDGHQVTATDGRVLDLGSFRASGGFLAEILNRQTGAEHYDYLHFYMGTIWGAQRAGGKGDGGGKGEGTGVVCAVNRGAEKGAGVVLRAPEAFFGGLPRGRRVSYRPRQGVVHGKTH